MITFRSRLLLVSLLVTGGANLATAADTRIDNIPMYGQPDIPRPERLRQADDDFIRDAVAGFGSREAASKAWFAQGEEFVAKRDFDSAMRRYNQSWLLDPNNYQPFWGFGRVLLEARKFDEAIGHLEKAKRLVVDPIQRPALLADLGTAYSVKAGATSTEEDKRRIFDQANQSFSESVSVDPRYGNGWRRWAFSLYEQERFAEAWEKVRSARQNDARPFPSAFIRALEQKAPEPRR